MLGCCTHKTNQNHVYWPSKFAQTRNLTMVKVALSVLTQNIHHNTTAQRSKKSKKYIQGGMATGAVN